MRFFHIEQSSCSDDGLWAAKSDYGYAMIEFNYWEELDSSAVDTHGKYNIQAGFVSLENAGHNREALKTCGYELDENGDIWAPYSGDVLAKAKSRTFNLILASCLWHYGHKDIAGDFSGNNREALFKMARNSL